jgi:hypothetical protein
MTAQRLRSILHHLHHPICIMMQLQMQVSTTASGGDAVGIVRLLPFISVGAVLLHC